MAIVRNCYFVGPTKKVISSFPDPVKLGVGQALFDAQVGREALNVKALKGFGGRGVLEIVEDFDGDTFRAVYTLRFSTAVYVLHAFQKKSKSGIATPQREIELITKRMKDAEIRHKQLSAKGE